MSVYKIEEVKETLNNGETSSAFYVYELFWLFFRLYQTEYLHLKEVKLNFKSLENAKEHIKILKKKIDEENFAKKVKKSRENTSYYMKKLLSINYIIEPQYKKRWFRKGKTVYNLIKIEIGKQWFDPSYGNGGGNLIDFKSTTKVGEFDYFESAETIKKQLTNGK